jgi:iron complex outermembrane receptor protein
VTERWKLHANYSLLKVRSRLDPSSRDIGYERTDSNSPNHQFHLRSYLSLPRNFELDTALYYVGRFISRTVPAYTRLDVRFGWRLTEHLELSVATQNLLDRQHPEFDDKNQGVRLSEISRSGYGKLTWRF